MTDFISNELLAELLEDKNFKADNYKTIEMIEYINKFLHNLGLIYTIAYVNMHSLFIPTFGQQKNSNLIVVNKGFGKTTFLKSIAENNKKHVQVLDEKMYESMLIKENKEFFHKKIIIHYDLVQGLFGLDKKQKEQIMGFWTSLLSDGRYSRQGVNKIVDVECLVMFPIAKESFIKHRKSMFEATFLDRLALINEEVNFVDRLDVFDMRLEDDKEKMKIKLVNNKSKKIKLDKKIIGPKIRDFVMELDRFDVMTSTRAQDYVFNILLCNAYVNDRKEVNDNDILMYKVFHEYHIEKGDIDKYNRIARLLDKNEDLSYIDISKILHINRKTVGKYARMYKERSNAEILQVERQNKRDVMTNESLQKVITKQS